MSQNIIEYERGEIDNILPHIKANLPPLIYKYREWENDFHKTILTKDEVWFAHPKSLNDPYDIRTKVRFDFSELENPLFFEKMKEGLKSILNWAPESYEFKTFCRNHFEIIKSNPENYFQENYLLMRDSNIYDEMGVFSLTFNCLNPSMWIFYSNHFRGICIGFSTPSLLSDLQQNAAPVEYSDELFVHSFLKNERITAMDSFFIKERKWVYEEEYRLFTYEINEQSPRAQPFSPTTIKEVIVGSNISKKSLKEIADLIKFKYNNSVKLFEVIIDECGYKLTKRQIEF